MIIFLGVQVVVRAGTAEQNGHDAEQVRVVVPAALIQQQHEPVRRGEQQAAQAEAVAQHHSHRPWKEGNASNALGHFEFR